MAINKKLIHFKSRDNFDREVANENILDTSICFIQDSKEISTHGTIYSTVNWSVLGLLPVDVGDIIYESNNQIKAIQAGIWKDSLGIPMGIILTKPQANNCTMLHLNLINKRIYYSASAQSLNNDGKNNTGRILEYHSNLSLNNYCYIPSNNELNLIRNNLEKINNTLTILSKNTLDGCIVQSSTITVYTGNCYVISGISIANKNISNTSINSEDHISEYYIIPQFREITYTE